LAATCPQPFGDNSILPTRRLCQAVLDRLKDHTVVLEGTGADVCFGYFRLVQSWQSVYRVPDALRRLGAALYVSRRLWLSPPSRVERWLRLARRASMLPRVAATVGQNPLAGVVYAAPASVQAEVSERLEEWMTKTLPSQEPGIKIIGLDLALGCANAAAQKCQPLFTGGPTRIAYPFLDPTIVSLALQRASHWPGREQPKQVLKAALTRHVPCEMVHRPTSNFVAPMERIYATSRFLNVFDRLLAADAPLAPFVIRSSLQRLRCVLPSGAPLPFQTVNAVWSLTSANLWLEQIAQLYRMRESSSSPRVVSA
jgi:Asparagine synthase